MEVPEIIFSDEQKKTLTIYNKEHFSANDFSLTETEIETARIELHETEETKIQKLQELIDKLARDKDVNYRTDTPFLLRYLRVRKYDSARAYQSIKDSYTFKNKFPENLYIPPNIQKLLDLNIVRYLPYTDEYGRVIFYVALENWNIQATSASDVIHITHKVCNIVSMNPKTQVNGCICILNGKSLSFQHVTSVWRSVGAYGFIFILLSMYPWRSKHFIVVNTGSLTRLFYKIVRPFVSKKHADRVSLLGTDMKDLHKYANPALLPKKLGGSIDNQYSVTQNVLDNISYIKYDNTFN